MAASWFLMSQACACSEVGTHATAGIWLLAAACSRQCHASWADIAQYSHLLEVGVVGDCVLAAGPPPCPTVTA